MVETIETSSRALTQVTWLVIGGTGQLGQALSGVLKQLKIPYLCVGSKELDIRSEINCHSYITRLKPGVVINAAAWTNVDAAEKDPLGARLINSIGAANVAKAAKHANSILAHVSTDYVFSGKSTKPWDEMDPTTPQSIYGQTKLDGELHVLQEYREKSYIFRTAWLYSQWGKNFAKTMTRHALFSHGEIKVVNDQVGQPTCAIDLAHQIVATLKLDLPKGIYHATNGGSGSWFDFAQAIFELTGESTTRLKPISSLEYPQVAARPEYSVLGHKGWNVLDADGAMLLPMRDWKIALQARMPEIISTIRKERN